MLNNCDIWAIQYYPEVLQTALENIKTGEKVILYKNCSSKFKIGDKLISNRQFDTILYSEESDLLILLMRGGKATYEQIIIFLSKNKINYIEYDLKEINKEDYEDGDDIPELWFAREKYVVQDGINESKEKGIKKLKYYKNVQSQLLIGNNDKYETIELRCKGIIQLKDKLIMIINHNYNKNMSEQQVIDCIINSNIQYEIDEDCSPDVRVSNFSQLL